MYCGECGKLVDDTDSFCGNCGEKVSEYAKDSPKQNVKRNQIILISMVIVLVSCVFVVLKEAGWNQNSDDVALMYRYA